MPQVVGYSAGHADAYHAEEPGAVQNVHDDDAEHAPRKGVDHAEDSAEQKARQEDPGHVDCEGVAETHAVDGDDYHQVGQAQLDAGHGHGKGNQEFDVAEDQCQSRKHGAYGYQAGAGIFSRR